MIWPIHKVPPKITCPEGYKLRNFQKGEEEKYVALLNSTKELGEWTIEKIQSILENILSPEGIYFVIWKNIPVATACALDKDNKKAELAWVAVDPAHRGKKLGMVVCGAVVKHLIDCGYNNIYLLTDHWRIPAIKTYLNLGFEPEIKNPEDIPIWTEIYKKLKLNFSFPKNQSI